MIEKIQLGNVIGDFLRWNDFTALCKQWIIGGALHHIVTLNPEMVILAQRDQIFREAVNKAQLRVPDGSGLIWAQWYIRSQFWSLLPSLFAFSFRTVERIPGVDAVEALAKLSQEVNRPIYLLGGTRAQVTRTAEKLRRRFDGLKIFTSPDHHFDLAGPTAIVSDIVSKKPAVVLVAYGAPKQTIWIEQHRQTLAAAEVRIAIGVGGAFAILSEQKPRAPKVLRQLNLEWLWRLILEPTRLPRIWRATVQFPLLIAKQKDDLSTPLH